MLRNAFLNETAVDCFFLLLGRLTTVNFLPLPLRDESRSRAERVVEKDLAFVPNMLIDYIYIVVF